MNNIDTLSTITIMPCDLNANGTLFGGQLLKWMDEQAYICARKNLDKQIVTVCVEKVKFLEAAQKGDLLEILTKITNIHGAKIEIKIETFISRKSGAVKNAEAFFTMAAVDENGKPSRIF
jgi:acyl-CoA hydrolase